MFAVFFRAIIAEITDPSRRFQTIRSRMSNVKLRGCRLGSLDMARSKEFDPARALDKAMRLFGAQVTKTPPLKHS